jgi:hypothetical protein
MRKAPAQIKLPTPLAQGMQIAWNQSLPLGNAQEHGGQLVRNKDGSLKWLPHAPGDADGIVLDYEGTSPHQKLLAGVHTHPYSTEEGNLTHMPFSGTDLGDQVYEQNRLSLVQSGEGLFGSARTREFDALVAQRDEAGREELARDIRRFFHTLYKNGKGNPQERAEAANRATSEHYHLLYYAGKNGILTKVDPAKRH